jgi:Zn-dependent protease with chaperone function
MPMLLLLLLTLACLPDDWPTPVLGSGSPARCAAATWMAIGLLSCLPWFVSRWVCRNAAEPERREAVVHRYHRWRFLYLLLLMGVFAAALYLLGWGWTVQQLAGRAPGAEMLLLLPFLVGLFLSWTAFYDAERALHMDTAEHPFWTRTGYVGFHLRQNLALVLVPIFLLVAMKALQRLAPPSNETAVLAASLASVALAVLVFVFMPWILKLVLGLKPLPDGPVRDRLEATARRLHFRCSDILLWNTRSGVANAMVAGLVPWVRYVMLTDRLLEDMTLDEVDAVFGHEIGHVKHSHMLYYLGFLKLSLAVLWVAWAWATFALPVLARLDNSLQALPLVGVLGAYLFVVFGFLSRRCERQADVYGCRAVSCADRACAGHDHFTALAPRGHGLCPTGIRTFISALEKVARLNGISRDRPGWLQSWQHSTIARRVDFLQGLLENPAREPRFQRRVAFVKWGLFLGLGALLVALAATGWEHLTEAGSPDEPEPAAVAGG